MQQCLPSVLELVFFFALAHAAAALPFLQLVEATTATTIAEGAFACGVTEAFFSGCGP